MESLVYQFMPFMIAFIISEGIYIKLDKDKKITKKISDKINITQKWKPTLIFVIEIVLLLIICLAIDSFISVNTIVRFSLVGLIIGLFTIIMYRIKLV